MSAPIHRPGYQRRDYHIVDYQEYELPGTGLLFRGPDPGPADPGQQITFIGAAQTYGCLTDRPFPAITGELLGRPVRNLGYGGAGPRFFLENRRLIEEANASAAVVVQVMSSRSEDNRLFRSGGLEYLERVSDGARLSASDAYGGLVGGFDPVTGRPVNRNTRRVNSRLHRWKLRRVVAETQQNWIENSTRLLESIVAPTVLLWFSTRRPTDYTPRYRTVGELFGKFPQMVTADMVAQIKTVADTYMEVVSSAGLPQPLFSRLDGTRTTLDPALDRPDLGGDVWHHNRYYPSPEMHEAAGKAVASALITLLS